MADDIQVANYKKSVERITENWSKKLERIAKDLAPIDDELDKLEAIKDPSADDKKRIAELTKKRADVRKLIDKAALELKVDLMLIELPSKADDKELVKLPAWLKEIIKKKGVPLGKHVSIAPNADIDVKAKKLKSFGITFKFD
jgi:hypothetical protein